MTPIAEIIFSGFVSKVVNDIADISKDGIRKAVKSKSAKNQNIESQIYNVVVNVLNKITNKQYEDDQDKIYDTAEGLLKILKKSEGSALRNINSCLLELGLSVCESEYLEFKMSLCEELGRDEYSELFRAILLLLLEQKSKYDDTVYVQLNQKLDEVILIINKEKNDGESNGTKQNIKSRTQEYANKWKENMFLNNFDKHDGNIGINVKLKDVYLEKHLPHFKWRNNKGNPDTKLKKLLSEYIYTQDKRKMLLVLGQPGIGKSTLITWIIINFKRVVDNILVYQFASDLKNMDVCNLDKDKKTITLGELELSFDDLEGKILILDGFDEISLKRDRTEVLNRLYKYLIKEDLLRKFSLIVTCRENYIQNVYRIDCDYVTLQSWGDNQIQSFCKVYSKKTKSIISDSTMMNIIKNKEVLGIPLILYMVLALDISVEKEGSIVDVYDQIFSLKEGGIYERCFVNIKKNKMEKYADPHWVYSLKEQIHQISRDISLWMFENNPNEASIIRDKYTEICTNIVEKSNQNTENIEQDVLIGSYFKLVRHTEGIDTEKLSFVHRSIYEYFFIEYLCVSMCQAINESQEQLASIFGNFLKVGKLSETMCEFLRHKVKICELNDKYNIVKDTFELMLHNGMVYHTGINYKRAGKLEGVVFANMLEILHLWERDSFSFSSEIVWYLIHNECERLNLNRIDLRDKNIKGAYLEGAHLREVDLRGVSLERVDLRGADLKGAILDENQVKHLNGICDLHGARVYLKDTNEIVNY